MTTESAEVASEDRFEMLDTAIASAERDVARITTTIEFIKEVQIALSILREQLPVEARPASYIYGYQAPSAYSYANDGWMQFYLDIDANQPWIERAKIITRVRKALSIKKLERRIGEPNYLGIATVSYSGVGSLPGIDARIRFDISGQSDAVLSPRCTLIEDGVEMVERKKYKTVCS